MKCGIEAIPYGETVWYKELRESKGRKNQLESEHKEGVWLGHSRSSNEAIIGTPEGIVRAYSIHRKPLGERWDQDRIQSMRGIPQQPNPNVPGLEIPIRVRFDEGAEIEAEAAVPAKPEPDIRRMRISPEMLKKYR